MNCKYIVNTLFLLFLISTNQAQIINTIAGKNSGEGAIATSIGVVPANPAVDKLGNIFFSEPKKHIVKKLSINGILSVMAGNGISGFSGDGGLATQAQLQNPYNVAIDNNGNIFIADSYDNRIRKVTSNGIITTIAGNGKAGYSGDGGLATSAQLSGPNAVATDNYGNVYIADFGNIRVRRVDTNGIITTVVGNGKQGFYGDGGSATSTSLGFPVGVAVSSAGELFITDVATNKIRKVDTNGIITTIAGNGTGGFSGDGGAATSAQLNQPSGSVSIDSAGNIFIPDSYNNRIRKVDVNGIITTVAGNGIGAFSGDGSKAVNAALSYPTGVALDIKGNILVNVNYHIRKVSTNGIISTVAGDGTGGYSGDGMPAISSELFGPTQIVCDASENIFVNQDGRICKINPDGIITTVAGTGLIGYNGDGEAAVSAQIDPYSSAVDTATGNIFIASNYRVRKVGKTKIITTIAGDSTQGYSGDGGPATSAQFNIISCIAADTKGNIYISDRYNFRIRKINANGIITTIAGTGTEGFSGDGGLAVAAQIDFVPALTVDTAGNVFISDGSQRIRKIDNNGIITTVAGNGTIGFSGDGGPAVNAQLNYPGVLTMDSKGNIFFYDYGNNRIRKVSFSGTISTIAGGGSFYGDGGAATSASVPSLGGISIDRSEAIFFTDPVNHRIRKISGNSLPLTLLQFTAQLKNTQVVLQWQTTSEINTSHFVLEHSHNGKDFSYIGNEVASHNLGRNTYDYTDPLPFTGMNYYRLKLIDKDGKLTYSNILLIDITNNFITALRVFPNPATTVINVQITTKQAGKIILKLIDESGKILQKQSYQNTVSTLSTLLSIEKLTAGIYYLTIDGNDKREKKTFIKQ